MKRRVFLQNIAWLSGGLLLSASAPARLLIAKKKKLKGRIHANGKGIANVVVSDGYNVVVTDADGRYEFKPHKEAVSVFMSTPSGYAFVHEKNIARHYHLLGNKYENSNFDFELTSLGRDDNEHRFIIWADPQVKNAKDVEKMMSESVPSVKKTVAGMEAGTLVHGITVGDIVWDELGLFASYDRAVEEMNIPFFQCLGNHDMDYRKGGDETSDDSFTQAYGPTYYSFNRGSVHYVVMDNVRYLGVERDYDGYVQQNQLDWLERDLSFVPKDRLIVLCLHIPVHSGVKNKEALYALLRDRDVHIMSGHTHYNVNAIDNNIYEHNHGTVCGAWWTGPICEDGTPCGYGVYTVRGKELSWHYQATGKPADYQMRIYSKPDASGNKEVLVNVWNFDPAWKVEYMVDGQPKGALTMFETVDPDANRTMLGPDLPKPRGFAEPKINKHMFRALVPATASKVEVHATDRFGRTYIETHSITA